MAETDSKPKDASVADTEAAMNLLREGAEHLASGVAKLWHGGGLFLAEAIKNATAPAAAKDDAPKGD